MDVPGGDHVPPTVAMQEVSAEAFRVDETVPAGQGRRYSLHDP